MIEDPWASKISLQEKRLRASSEYSVLWKRIVKEWDDIQAGDHAWLSYAANYFLYTSGIHWAVDPFSMSSRVPGINKPDYHTDLQKLELVVLTHSHNDHCDIQLISALMDLPIQWIVPDHMVDDLVASVPDLVNKMVVVSPGEIIHYKNLTLSAFDSLHFHGNSGVAETGYLAEFDNKRWLFPGDVRNYDLGKLPAFGKLTGCFAHLWLGKASALIQNPPLLDDFCNFFAGFDTTRLVISHLYEFGRDEFDLWDETHYHIVRNRLKIITPDTLIDKAVMGDRLSI